MGEHETIVDEINKESKSMGVMVCDAMETYCVREECMGTRPA